MPITPKNNPFVTVIFSFNRPLQLDLSLTTNEKYCLEKNGRNEYVLYKASNERYEAAYQKLMTEHPNVQFIKEKNFKSDLYECIKKKEYVLFIVDDCIFTRKYSISTVSNFLDICDGALGFSLRLGTNTKYCYPLYIKNDIPYMQNLGNNVYGFSWKEAGKGDFSYPLELSSSMYRIKDIKPIIEGLHYTNPNQLEWAMYNYIINLTNKSFLLCYETSPAFCNPINRIQEENNNRVGINPDYSIENMLRAYESGYRINHEKFDGFISNGCHQEIDIEYERR
jgi:hypothetical protein